MKENEFSKIIELLPAGWEQAAKETGTFTRSLLSTAICESFVNQGRFFPGEK